jgi:hypothetical protein
MMRGSIMFTRLFTRLHDIEGVAGQTHDGFRVAADVVYLICPTDEAAE